VTGGADECVVPSLERSAVLGLPAVITVTGAGHVGDGSGGGCRPALGHVATPTLVLINGVAMTDGNAPKVGTGRGRGSPDAVSPSAVPGLTGVVGFPGADGDQPLRPCLGWRHACSYILITPPRRELMY